MILTIWWAPFVVSIFTKPQPHGLSIYKWGSLWGTFDNPPQGDEGFVTKRAPFPNVTKDFKGYINRSMWIFRNKLYNLKYIFRVEYKNSTTKTIYGNPDISDKYKIPGWLFVIVRDRKKVVAWEWYSITPYSKKRNVRIRMGWKVKGRKFEQKGDFAQLVYTFNPVDGYGNN